MAREGVVLRCIDCKERNYITKINKKKQVEKLQIKKFCSKCRKQTIHSQMKPKK